MGKTMSDTNEIKSEEELYQIMQKDIEESRKDFKQVQKELTQLNADGDEEFES